MESVNTGFCYSKPCEILVEEGWQYFPEGREMRVLSVGMSLRDIDNIGLARPSIIDAPEKAAKSSRILAARSFCARLAPTHLSVLSTLQMQKREGQVEMALTDRESNSSRSMRIPKGIMTLTMIRAVVLRAYCNRPSLINMINVKEITSRKWPLHKSKQRQIRWFRHAVGRNCPGWYQKATTQKPHPTSTFNHAVKIKEYTPLGDDCDDVELPYIKAFVAVLAEDIKVFPVRFTTSHYTLRILQQYVEDLCLVHLIGSFNSIFWEACGRPAPEAELGVIYQVITRGVLICFQSEIVHLLQPKADQKKSELEEVDSGAAHSGSITKKGLIISYVLPTEGASIRDDFDEDVDIFPATPGSKSLFNYHTTKILFDSYQWLLSEVSQHGRLTFSDPSLMFSTGARIHIPLRTQAALRKIRR
uniref:Uncharacterized protein n=1 Tax=Coccidioides posadasii RMSCC 3488 TaxID=454284 RepID=A0A0J6FHN4_COCPO|nr:LOW QUALITY PROTEIN: hypothetical protein CPAG_04663 [Coccidioides posadasii RMSCC 3488]